MPLQTVLTLGPASADEDTLAQLLAVADRVRLNTSHLDVPGLQDWLERLDGLCGCATPIVLDLQGAKMRIGAYPSVESIPSRVSLVPAESSAVAAEIPVPHPELFHQLVAGELLSLNDARISLRVEVVEESRIVASRLADGPLSSFKGINRREHPLELETLSRRDLAMIEATRTRRDVQYALSFVQSGAEAQVARRAIAGQPLIAKVELPGAMEHLSRIDQAFDEIWLCRGDLGAQAGLGRIGALQAEFSAQIPTFSSPAYLAGQVLEHLTHFSTPTRTELVHLHDIEALGYAGFVLSDETAVGKNPIAVAHCLREILGP